MNHGLLNVFCFTGDSSYVSIRRLIPSFQPLKDAYTMRCKACNKIMTEQEMTKKDNRGEYIDLCSDCYSPALEATFDAFDYPLFGNITQTNEDEFTD